MLRLFNNNYNIELYRLLRIFRYSRKFDIGIESHDEYDLSGYTNYNVKFNNIEIKDLIIRDNSFFSEEKHHIKIIISDSKNDLVVYESPTIYVNEKRAFDDLEIYIYSDSYPHTEIHCGYSNIKWIHKGEWCIYINSKVKEFEDIISKKKMEEERKRILSEENKRKTTNKLINDFDKLFKNLNEK